MADNLAHGIDAKTFARIEASYDTASSLAATNAVALLEPLKLTPEQAASSSKAHVGTASEQLMVLGKKSGKWSASSEIRPAAPGTPPDIGPDLLKAAFGVETVVGGTSVTYALSDGAPASLQLGQSVGDGLFEGCTGAWVDQVDIEVPGGGDPKISLQGGYASHQWAYGTAVGAGGAASGANAVPYAAAHRGNLGQGACVAIGSRTNGGAGYLITSVNDTPTPPSFAVSPVLEGAVALDDVIRPVIPTPVLGGTPLGAIACALTIDGTAVGFISAKLSYKTGHHARDKEATANRPTGVSRSRREITGEFQVYFLDKTTGPVIGRAWSGTTRAIVIRVGENSPGKRMTINVPKAFLEVVPIEIPDAEESTAALKFRALQNVTAADELTIVFD